MKFQEITSKKGVEFQNRISGILKKHDLKARLLDLDNNGRKPDFLITNNQNKEFIGECKGIYSDGWRNDCHISTLDSAFIQKDYVDISKMNLDNIEETLKDSLMQFNQLIYGCPGEYNNLPFVVFLELDFFADDFNFIKNDLFGLNSISALVKIEKNAERENTLLSWDSEKIRKRINKKMQDKVPPESIRFKILLNRNANNKLKANDFFIDPIIV